MKKIKLNKKGIAVLCITAIALIIIVVGLIVSLNNKDTKKESTPNIKEEEIQEKVKIIDVNSNIRPYAVMINCHNSALPQSGLDKAYIVYELMVEGGITRMMALFKDVDVNKIGSVRSARTQYLPYVLENDAIYAHAGGAKDALEMISSKGFEDVDVDGQYGIRDSALDRPWEHTLFTTTDLLNSAVTNNGIRNTTEIKNLLNYSAKEIDLSSFENSTVANNISIKYSDYRTSNYKYDENLKMYLRNMNETPNVDLVTNEQYKVKNILVYAVNYTSYTYSGYYGYQKLDNIGTGDGYYISNGYAIPITWEKKDEGSQTIYKVKSTGEELVVNDGNTYIQIYPTSGSFSMN